MEIQKYWHLIRDEGLKLLSGYSDEAENLKEKGDWKQLELFARGARTDKCKMAPFTCKLIENFKAASSCKRGQVKFSVLQPNTHIHSHCGPTNCRIRCHLGLKVPEKTFIRVANETKSWKVSIFISFFNAIFNFI
jgi:aspartate beta-hydroxylase